MDEDRLVERANAIVDRPERAAQAENPVARRARVARVVRELRDRHECEHRGQWRRIPGEHRCEECGDTLNEFILECSGCMVQACVRCMYNRL